MIKKVLPVVFLLVIIYPPFRAWFLSKKFNKFLEDRVQFYIDDVAISQSKFENSVKNEIVKSAPDYNVLFKKGGLTFQWAEDTLIVNVVYTIPVNYWVYRLYPEYHHSFQVDLREIMKTKRLKEKIERRYRSLP